MLNLSTGARYAVRIMVFLARSADGRSATKNEIATGEDVSVMYAEQILLKLKRAGLVISRRGPGGGFLIGKDPGTITVGDVLRVADGPIRLAPCEEDKCKRGSICVTRRVWDQATRALEEVFDSTTIWQLAEDMKKKNQTISYQI